MSHNGFVKAQDILNCSQRRYQIISIPHIGKVRLQSLTEFERGQMEQVLDENRRHETRAWYIAACVVNANGDREFTQHDISQIMQLDTRVTAALFDAIVRHCGMEQADFEELEKNSESIPVASSPTG